MMQTDRPPKWVSDKFLAEHYQVSRATIWRWARIGKLPAPEKIGENTSRFDFEIISAGEQTQLELPGV